MIGPDGTKRSAAAPQLAFTLDLQDGRGLIRATGRYGDLVDASLSMEVPNVTFPFDLTGGPARFQKRRCRLRTARLRFDEEALATLWGRCASAQAYGIFDLRTRLTTAGLEAVGRLKVGERECAFSAKGTLEPEGQQTVLLTLHDVRIYGWVPVPAPLVSLGLLLGLGAQRPEDQKPALREGGLGPATAVPDRMVPQLSGTSTCSLSPLGLILRRLLPEWGYRIPDSSQVSLVDIVSTDGFVDLDFTSADEPEAAAAVAARQGGDDGSPAPLRALAYRQAVQLFREAESMLARGEVGAALTSYQRALDRAGRHPFLMERILALEVASPRPALQEDAEEIARHLVVEDPSHLAALHALAALCERRGDLREAAEHYRSLAQRARRHGENEDALCAEAAAAKLLFQVDPATSASAYERILADQPRHRPALAALCSLYARLERWDALALVSRRLANLAGTPAEEIEARLLLADLYLDRLADPARAKAEIDRVLRLDDMHPRGLEALARVHEAQGDHRKAIRTVDRLVELVETEGDDRRQAELNLRAARLWEKTGDEASALLRYKQAIEQAQKAGSAAEPVLIEATRTFAQLSGRRGQWSQSLEGYESLLLRAVPRAPAAAAESGEGPLTQPAILLQMARIHFDELADPAEAHRLLDRALALDPEDRGALALMARVAEKGGRIVELIDWRRREAAAARAAGDPARAAVLHAEIGRLLSGEPAPDGPDGATRAYESALSLDGGHEQAAAWLLELATLHDRAGRGKQLRETLQRLLAARAGEAAGPEQARWAARLGKLWLTLEPRDPRKGEQYTRAALEADPENLEALESMVRLQPEEGEPAPPLEERAQWLQRLAAVYERCPDPAAPTPGGISVARREAELATELGTIYLAAGREAAALSMFDRAAERAPDDPRPLEALADLRRRHGDAAGASRALQRLVTLLEAGASSAPGAAPSSAAGSAAGGAAAAATAVAPGNTTLARAFTDLAALAESRQDVVAATAHLEAALRHESGTPERARLWQRRVEILQRHERFADAARVAEEAAGDRSPTDLGRVHFLLLAADLYRRELGDPGRALACVDRALELQPGHARGLDVAESLATELGDLPRVALVLEAKAAQLPDGERRLGLYRRMAQVQVALGADERAADIYERALAIREDYRPALVHLAARAHQAEDLERAESLYLRMASARFQPPDDPEEATAYLAERSAALAFLAERAQARGDRVQAGQHAEDALAHDPFHVPSLRLLERMCSEAGRWDRLCEVLGALQKTTSSADELVAHGLRRAELFEQKLRRRKEAAACYRQVLALSPEEPRALLGVVRVLREEGALRPPGDTGAAASTRELLGVLGRLVELVESPFEPEHPVPLPPLSELLIEMAELSLQVGDGREAERLWRRVLSALEPGGDGALAAEVLDGLLRIARQRGDGAMQDEILGHRISFARDPAEMLLRRLERAELRFRELSDAAGALSELAEVMAVGSGPSLARALALRAEIHHERQEPEEAAQALAELLRVPDAGGGAPAGRADLLRRLGRLHRDQLGGPGADARLAREAAAVWAELCNLLPDDLEAHTELVRVLRRLGQGPGKGADGLPAALERLLALTRRRLAGSDAEADLLIELGYLYQNAGQTQAAVERWRAAVTLRPRDPLALEGLFNAQLAAGELEAAGGWLQQLAQLGPDPAQEARWSLQLGQAWGEAGQPAAAARWHLRTAQLVPGRDVRAEVLRAGARLAHEARDAALLTELLQPLVAGAPAAPDDPVAREDRRQLAAALATAGRPAEAAAVWEALEEHASVRDEARAMLRQLWASAGQWSRLAEHLERWAAEVPAAEKAGHFADAATLWASRAGRPDRAEAALRAAHLCLAAAGADQDTQRTELESAQDGSLTPVGAEQLLLEADRLLGDGSPGGGPRLLEHLERLADPAEGLTPGQRLRVYRRLIDRRRQLATPGRELERLLERALALPGQPDQHTALYEQLLEVQAASPDARGREVETLRRATRLSGAPAAWRAARLVQLAELLLQRQPAGGHPAESTAEPRRLLEEVLRLDPPAATWEAAGRLAESAGALDLAWQVRQHQLETARERPTQRGRVLREQVRLARALGRPQDGGAALSELVTLEPDDESLAAALEQHLDSTGQARARREVLERRARASRSPEVRARLLLELARLAVAEDDRRGAAGLLRRALADDEASVPALTLWAETALALRDHGATASALERLYHLSPADQHGARAELSLRLGGLYLELVGDLVRARLALRRGLEEALLENELPGAEQRRLVEEALRPLLIVARRAGDHAEAELTLKDLARLGLASPEDYEALGDLLSGRGAHAEASSSYGRVATDRRTPALLRKHTQALRAAGQLAPLAELLEREGGAFSVKGLDDEAIASWLEAAEVRQVSLGDAESALRLLWRAFQLRPGETNLFSRVLGLLRNPSRPVEPAALLEAHELHARALAGPARARVLYETAVLLGEQLGDGPGATRRLEQAREADPAYWPALRLLSERYAAEGRAHPAAQVLEELLAHAPLAESDRADLLARLSELRQAAGEAALARRAILDAARLSLDSPDPALSRQLLTRAIALVREVGPPSELAALLVQLADVPVIPETERRAALQEALDLNERLARATATAADGTEASHATPGPDPVALLERILAMDPPEDERARAQRRLSEHLRGQGAWDRLVQLKRAEHARQRAFLDGGETGAADAVFQLAQELASLCEGPLGLVQEGLTWRLEAVRLRPSAAGTVSTAVDGLVRAGRHGEAAELIEESIQRGLAVEMAPELWVRLGALYLDRLDDPARASSVLEAVHARGLLGQRAADLLARAYRTLGLEDELLGLLTLEAERTAEPRLCARLLRETGEILGRRPDRLADAAQALERAFLLDPAAQREAGERARTLLRASGELLRVERLLGAELRPDLPQIPSDREDQLRLERADLLAFSLDRPDAAEEELDRVLSKSQLSPEHLQRARLLRGRLLARGGHAAQALEILPAALTASAASLATADLLATLIELGTAYAATGQRHLAQRSFEEALQLDPTSVDALDGLEPLVHSSGQPSEMLGLLDHKLARARGPAERADVQHQRGAIYLQMGRRAEAAVAFRHALGDRPDHLPTARLLLPLCEEVGDWSTVASLMDLELSRTTDDEDATALRLRLARIQIERLVDPEAAVETLDSLLAAPVPPAEALALEAEARQSMGDPARAGEALERLALLEQAEGTHAVIVPRLAVRAAELFEQGGDLIGAIRAFRMASDLGGPQARHALEQLARLTEATLSPAERRAQLRERLQALSSDPEGGEVIIPTEERQDLLRSLLLAAVADRQDAEGEAYAAELFTSEPGENLSFNFLRHLYERQGRWEHLAGLHARRAAGVGEPGERAQCHFELGRVLSEKLGRETDASRAYEAALIDHPEHQAALDALADITYRQQDWERAAELYQQLEGRPSFLSAEERAFRRGEIAEYLGQVADAEAHYLSALAGQPGHLGALEARARLALEHPRSRRASREAVAALLAELGPDERERASELRIRMAQLLSREPEGDLGPIDLDAAAHELEDVLRAEPERTDALEALATIQERRGQWRVAADLLGRLARHVTGKDPRKTAVARAEVLFRLGELCHRALRDLDRAEDCYLRAYDLAPSHPRIARRLFDHYWQSGDVGAAADLAREAPRSVPSDAVDAPWMARMLLTLAAASQADPARRLASRLVAMRPRAEPTPFEPPTAPGAALIVDFAQVVSVMGSLRILLPEDCTGDAGALLARRLGLALTDPADVGLHLILANLFGRAGRGRRARTHASLVAFLGGQPPLTSDATLDRFLSGQLEFPPATSDGDQVHRSARGPLREVALALAASCERQPDEDPRCTPERLLPAMAPVLGEIFGALQDAAGVPAPAYLVEGGPLLLMEATSPPRIVVEKRLAARSLEECVYVLARALDLLRTGSVLLEDASVEQLTAGLEALVWVLSEGDTQLAEVAPLAELGVSPEAVLQSGLLASVVSAALAQLQGGETALHRWRTGMRWSADRTAFWVTGDLHASLCAHLLVEPGEGSDADRALTLRGSPAMRELCRFALSLDD
jgi:tetratricopeptide (TPR) repeat protein